MLRDRWISVRADHCVTAEGWKVAPYYVLECADWVQIVAIDEADRLVLVEQYRHGLGLTSLEIPAGAIEGDSESPAQAAARELLEETGYESADWQAIATLAANPANQNNRCHVMIALNARRMASGINDASERLSIHLMPVADVVAAAKSGAICQSMHVAALALALSAINRW